MLQAATIDNSIPEIVPFETATAASTDSRAVFEQLVRTHHQDLMVLALALTRDEPAARELVQDAFVIAWQKLEKFDQERDFGAWMRGIVRNKWREWLRRKPSVSPEKTEIAHIEQAVAHWQAEKHDGRPDLFETLEDCLQCLPGRLREAIRAYYYEDCSGDDAADHLETSPSALRKRLQRARTLLRECLERKSNRSPSLSSPES